MTKVQKNRFALSRRAFIGSSVTTFAMAGLAGRGLAQNTATELTIQLNWLETVDFAPLFAAELKGFDTNNGIAQSFVPGGPQIDPIQSVAGGAAPVGIGASIGQCALARAAGIPIKAIAAFNRQSPVGLISLQSNPILTPQDAIGKRIGLQGGARLPWSIILAENGLSEDQMTIVPVAGDVSPLVSGQIDGFWGTAINQHLALNRQGIENQIMTRNTVGAPEHFLVVFAMEQAIADRRADIVAWLRASMEGQAYYMENVDEVAQHVVDRSPALQLDVELQKAALESQIGYVQPIDKELPLLHIDQEAAEQAIAQLAAMGELASDVSLADLYDGSLLDEVYA